MAWDKAYPEAGIPWDNDNSPYLNETNMGIIDEALKTHDERIIELYGTRQTVAGYADAAQTAEINALAYSNNAQAQAVNSQVSAAYSQAEADRAKAEADRAFSGTPEGYDVLVDDVTGMKTTIPVIQEDVDAIEKNIGKAKNLAVSYPNRTLNGITITNNGDGSYTLNGTATAQANFDFLKMTSDGKKYKIFGCPSGGSTTTYMLRINNYPDTQNLANDVGDGIEIVNSIGLGVFIRIEKDFTCNNLVFKPMITDDLDAVEVVPYSGSAKNLIGDVSAIRNMLSDEWISKAYYKGDYVIYNNTLYVCILTHTSGIVPTNATYWKATTVNLELKGKLETLVVSSTSELDTLISDMPYNSAYIAYVLGGVGMIIGVKGSTTLQRQIRITCFGNEIASRLKYNSTTWSDWTNV